jgi:hypothetical protein
MRIAAHGSDFHRLTHPPSHCSRVPLALAATFAGALIAVARARVLIVVDFNTPVWYTCVAHRIAVDRRLYRFTGVGYEKPHLVIDDAICPSY